MPKEPEAPLVRGEPGLGFVNDDHLNKKKQWRLIMDYFKKNPAALMDAIPTPPNEEEEDQFQRARAISPH